MDQNNGKTEVDCVTLRDVSKSKSVSNDDLNRRLRLQHSELGMTLIEIMVVVTIIGLLLGGAGVVAFKQLVKSRITTTRKTIDQVKSALVHYAMDNPKKPCPNDLSDLKTEKYLDKAPVDAWSRPFIFKCPGEHDTDTGDISSAGADGSEGTDDDLNSWEE